MQNTHDVHGATFRLVENQMAALGLQPVAGAHVLARPAEFRSLGEPVKGLVEGKHILITLLAPPATFRVACDGAQIRLGLPGKRKGGHQVASSRSSSSMKLW